MPLRRAPASSPLQDAYLTTFDRIAPFYRYDPHAPQIWEQMMRRVDERAGRLPRRALVPILLEQNRTFGAGERTLANIRDLAREDTYAVTTGQQVGLFTGFLFTIYKAVTAVKLAERLERQYGRRVVPVFWMAADDHDFHEINHIYACTETNEVRRLELPHETPDDRRSAAHLRFGDGLPPLIDAFAATFPDSEFKSEVVETLRESCTPETPLSLGFARLMARLFQARGLILVDPTDPALKPLMRPVFSQEIRHPLATTRHILAAGEQLSQRGFHPQISRPPDAVNLFVYHEGRRTPVSYAEGRFSLRDTDIVYDRDTFLRMVETAPASFSQNVVTRPVLQDILFPTLTYIGGPSEIAYFAQFREVYAHFDLPSPVIYPRASLTLVERRVGRALEKYGLTIDDFIGDVFQVLGRRIRDEIPDELTAGLLHAREAVGVHFDRLVPQIAALDPTLEKTAESARRKALFELSKLEEKVEQSFRRTHKTMRQQIERANCRLYPRHQPQERTFNVWSYIALYGFEFMNTLFDAVDERDFDHQVVSL